MSRTHLTIGSQEPPRVTGLLRLYSMKYCPFAHRAILVLKAKGIPHDIVNINLLKKPEWYFQINKKGLVPALLDGDKIIIESIDICEYLEEKYPDNPLYPAEPEAKNQDKELIKQMDPVVSLYMKCCFTNEERTPEEWLVSFLEPLQVFENALSQRGTPFFGGNKPGMVDYMLWPWAERAGTLDLKLGQKLPIADDQLPLLCKWKKTIRNYPICSELYIPPEVFWEVVQIKLAGTAADYGDLD